MKQFEYEHLHSWEQLWAGHGMFLPNIGVVMRNIKRF